MILSTPDLAERPVRLDQVLRPPTTHPSWSARPLSPALLDDLHALLDLCPAAAPEIPARHLFISTEAGKARFVPHLRRGDRGAPGYAILAGDRAFAGEVACAAPHAPRAAAWAARRTLGLQGAYFTVAARSLGLEVATVTADLPALTREFFDSSRFQAIFAAAIGHAEPGVARG